MQAQASRVSLLKHMDIMAPPIQIRLAGFSGIKTFVGLLMTFVYTCGIISLGSFLVREFFDTSKPQVSVQETDTGAYPEFDLHAQKLLPVAYFFSQPTVRVPAQEVARYFTIKLVKKTRQNPADASQPLAEKVDLFDVVPCADSVSSAQDSSLYQHFDKTPYFKRFAQEFGMCVAVDPKNLKIYGGGADDEIVTLAYTLYPCSLATGCASEAEMKQVSFAFSVSGTSLNLSDFENPVSKYLNVDCFYHLMHGFKQFSRIELQSKDIIDDPGLYFNLKNKSRFSEVKKSTYRLLSRDATKLQCTLGEIEAAACSAFFEFEFASTGTNVKILRSYRGFVETLGDIGGVNEIVFILCWYTNWFYLLIAKQKVVVGKVFSFLTDPIFANFRTGNAQLSAREKLPLHRVQRVGPESERERAAEGPSLENQAYQLITGTLDVVTLVHEVNNIKLLTKILLHEYQESIAPLVILSLGRSKHKPRTRSLVEQTETSATATFRKMNTTPLSPHKKDLKQQKQPTCLSDSLKLAFEKYSENDGKMSFSDGSDLSRLITHKVDSFCCKSILESGVWSSQVVGSLKGQPAPQAPDLDTPGVFKLPAKLTTSQIEPLDLSEKIPFESFSKYPDAVELVVRKGRSGGLIPNALPSTTTKLPHSQISPPKMTKKKVTKKKSDFSALN